MFLIGVQLENSAPSQPPTPQLMKARKKKQSEGQSVYKYRRCVLKQLLVSGTHGSKVCGINQGFFFRFQCWRSRLTPRHAAKSLINGNRDKNPYNGERSASRLSSMRRAESCLECTDQEKPTEPRIGDID